MIKKELSNEFFETQSDLELEWINNYLNKLSHNGYNPIISDDVITLSICHEGNVESINSRMFQIFNIVLNETKEIVGCISFDYYSDSKDKYNVGNVTYIIGKVFQHKGYATRALKLLVNLLKKNNYKGDKDLYFWVSYYNEYSKKVVLNNGGEIVSGGESETKSPYILRIKI